MAYFGIIFFANMRGGVVEIVFALALKAEWPIVARQVTV